MKSRRKVGIALSGGSARGFAYIGVLRVLEKHDIPIDYIAGTSMGAVIAALYAAGYSTRELEKLVETTDWVDLIDFSDFERGLIRQQKIQDYLVKLFNGKRFEDLAIPCAITAVDINNGTEVVFESGDVMKAVSASMAIPGIFTPVEIGGSLYVDGGVIDPIPVGVLNQKGIDVTIAVDLSVHIDHYKTASVPVEEKNVIMEKAIAHGIENFKDYLGAMGFMPKPLLAFFNGESILMQFHKPVPEILDLSWKSFSLQSNELTKAKLVEHKPKVIIRPSIDDVGMFDFYKYKKCIRKGELATKRHIGEIKVLSQMQ